MGLRDVFDRAMNIAGQGLGMVKTGAESLAGQGWGAFADSHLPTVAGGGGGSSLPSIAGGGYGSNLPTLAGGGGGGGLPTLAGGYGGSNLPTLAGGVGDSRQQAINQAAGQAAYQTWTPKPQNTPGSSSSPTYSASTADPGSIQAWVQTTRPNSPIASIAPQVADYARSMNVDPGMLFGVLLKESQLGSDNGMGTAQNNPGNIMADGADPAHGKIILQNFPSMLDGVKAMVDLFANYGRLYGAKSVEDMIGIYYVGPEAYARYGLEANDAGGQGPGGNGTVRDYLEKFVYPTMEQFGALRAPVTSTAGAIDTARRYTGLAYTNEGIRTTGNPADGFDCSSLTGYALNLPRNLWNAQAQYDASQRIDASQLQPGDLVFFQGTTDNDPSARPVTHVGMYVGNGMMINAQNDGVREVSLNSPYWQQHLYGYGRIGTGGGGDNTGNR